MIPRNPERNQPEILRIPSKLFRRNPPKYIKIPTKFSRTWPPQTKKSPEVTPQKTKMSPENQWLEDIFPIKTTPFLGDFR